jgi:hypothetical protein
MHMHMVFNTTILEMSFLLSKNGLCWWISAYPIVGKKNSQYSTPLVGMRYFRHIPNSPKDKNKMMHHPCVLEKIVFLDSKTLLSPIGT